MAFGSLRVAAAGQALDLERDLAGVGVVAMGEKRVDLAPDHHAG